MVTVLVGRLYGEPSHGAAHRGLARDHPRVRQRRPRLDAQGAAPRPVPGGRASWSPRSSRRSGARRTRRTTPTLRGLVGEAREQRIAQAQAEVAGPYELEIMVTTWDRRENDLDRGKKSVWRVVLIDEDGQEIEPLEIVRTSGPPFVVRAEFPALGDFATPYIARFPRTRPILGPVAKHVRLRMSSKRGGLELDWTSG